MHNVNFSGTWRLRTHTQRTVKESREILEDEIKKEIILIDDSAEGLNIISCSEYGGPGRFWIKTEHRMYPALDKDPYLLTDNGDLHSSFEYEDLYDSGLEYVGTATLEKVSDSIDLAHGELSLSGGISFAGNSHVCVESVHDILSDILYLEVMAVNATQWIKQRTFIFDQFDEGVYRYEGPSNRQDSPLIVEFLLKDVYENTSGLLASDVSIEIEDVEWNSHLRGSVDFRSEDNDHFSHVFDVELW